MTPAELLRAHRIDIVIAEVHRPVFGRTAPPPVCCICTIKSSAAWDMFHYPSDRRPGDDAVVLWARDHRPRRLEHVVGPEIFNQLLEY